MGTSSRMNQRYSLLRRLLYLHVAIIKPGTMIVHQPDIPAPVLINFASPPGPPVAKRVHG